MQHVSNNPASLHNLYSEDAIHVDEKGTAIIGSDALIEFYSRKPLNVQRYTTKAAIAASRDSTIYYEVAEVESGSDLFDYVFIGKTVDGDSVRLFEFVAAANEGAQYPAAVEERRQLWMKYCNNHQVDGLVDELYATDPIYYNHKPLIRGKEMLKREYSYMERQQYRLTLTPIVMEPVNDSIAYEIGQCSGSYDGKYIIVWQLEPDGQWRVLLDSNI